MPPSHNSASKANRKALTPKNDKQKNKVVKSKKTPKKISSQDTQNIEEYDVMKDIYNKIDNEFTLRITPEICKKLTQDKIDLKGFIAEKLTSNVSGLELVGWSPHGKLDDSFYDSICASDLKIKKLILRGRGSWTPCKCPKSKGGQLVDLAAERGTTVLEHLVIVRTFTISSCTLLDLISRSPNLKTFNFYGSLAQEDHHENFATVNFMPNLEGVYWPWCNMKQHKPTLRTLIKRNDQIRTLYTSADIVCDFLNSQILPRVKYLSMIMNERWITEPGKTKVLKRYIMKMGFLESAKQVEALEIRTFDLNAAIALDEVNDSKAHHLIRLSYDDYKLKFWESIEKMTSLKYISIHGAWELEEVCRNLSERGIAIEFLRVSLMPNSILANVEGSEDNTNKNMQLSMAEAAKQISKLAKLKSLHFTCHENLVDIDRQTVTALRELSDLIWKIEIKCAFTENVEELLTNILRRGNQNGRSYRIRMVIRMADDSSDYANLYVETIEKFSSTTTLKNSLNEVASRRVKERYGKSSFKSLMIFGIEQAAGCRDKVAFDQLSTTWNTYNNVFEPVDAFM